MCEDVNVIKRFLTQAQTHRSLLNPQNHFQISNNKFIKDFDGFKHEISPPIINLVFPCFTFLCDHRTGKVSLYRVRIGHNHFIYAYTSSNLPLVLNYLNSSLLFPSSKRYILLAKRHACSFKVIRDKRIKLSKEYKKKLQTVFYIY